MKNSAPSAGLELRRAAAVVLPELRRAAAVVLPEAFKVLPVGPGPRFDSDRVNPCFKPRAGAGGRRLCIPYFYILGQFHSGAFDLYERISHHPSVAHRPPAASRYNGEVHAWEKMMWRGCDYGSCPRRRGAGAEPIPLPAALANDRGAVFGEVMGGGLSFTWGATHSLMHSTYTANMTACWQAGFRGPQQQVCYGRAMAAQSEWERSIGAGAAGQFTVPWLMRAVHGTSKVRMLAIVREPSRRLHSAYYFWPQYRRRYGSGGDGFVAYVQATLPALRDCFAAHGPRVCARSFEGLDQKYEQVYYHADQFFKGAYALYVDEWLRAFGKERVRVIRAEDYWATPYQTLASVFGFLGVAPLPESQLREIAARPTTYLPGSNATFAADRRIVNRVRSVPAAATSGGHTLTRVPEPMPDEAAVLLRSFYAPLNAELATMLGDERFLWEGV
jgi:hypothetical protein